MINIKNKLGENPDANDKFVRLYCKTHDIDHIIPKKYVRKTVFWLNKNLGCKDFEVLDYAI